MNPSLPDPAVLPPLLCENLQGTLSRSDIRFEPFQSVSRSNAEICWLFRPEEANGAGAALVRYQPGGWSPPHLHPSFELIYMLDGEISTSQGSVKKGDLILLSPNSRHSMQCETGCLALVIWIRMPILQSTEQST